MTRAESNKKFNLTDIYGQITFYSIHYGLSKQDILPLATEDSVACLQNRVTQAGESTGHDIFNINDGRNRKLPYTGGLGHQEVQRYVDISLVIIEPEDH